jgi:hypothetical protein
MEMVSTTYFDHLKALVDQSRVSMKAIDEPRRIRLAVPRASSRSSECSNSGSGLTFCHAPLRFSDCFSNEFQRETCIAVDEIDSNGLAIDYRQSTAQFIADTPAITRLQATLQ